MTDVIPTQDEINTARSGIYLQLGATTRLAEVYGSLANAIVELELDDFIENQVQVIASSRAWIAHTERRLREEME